MFDFFRGVSRSLGYRRLCIAGAAFISSHAHASQLLNGQVVEVADGDTLTIVDAGGEQHRIRLAEIDAPEGDQAYGEQAGCWLRAVCQGKQAKGPYHGLR